jgi:murein lipoprotein
MRYRWYQPLIIVLAGASLVGCASTAQKEELAAVRVVAEQAAADAAEAKRMAAEAEREAAAAKLAAEQARADAAAANAKSAETEAKIDRMFKKAMYK